MATFLWCNTRDLCGAMGCTCARELVSDGGPAVGRQEGFGIEAGRWIVGIEAGRGIQSKRRPRELPRRARLWPWSHARTISAPPQGRARHRSSITSPQPARRGRDEASCDRRARCSVRPRSGHARARLLGERGMEEAARGCSRDSCAPQQEEVAGRGYGTWAPDACRFPRVDLYFPPRNEAAVSFVIHRFVRSTTPRRLACLKATTTPTVL